MASNNPPKSLPEATERLRVRNDQLAAYLNGRSYSALERIANAPDATLEEVTDRARKYWDAHSSNPRARRAQ